MRTLSRQLPSPGPGTRIVWGRVGFVPSVTRLARGLLDVLLLWQGRAADRWTLATLDECGLRDVGLTRIQAERESAKPFWSL